jgi:hypothetical protein
LRPGGRLDRSFGRRRIDMGGRDFGRGIAIGPGGRIVVAGTAMLGSGRSVGFALRLRAGGSLDPTWSGDGRKRLPADAFKVGFFDVVLERDGDVTAAGRIGSDAVIAAFQPDGDSVLWRTIDYQTGRDRANAIARGRHGKLLVVGRIDAAISTGGSIEFQPRMGVTRLLAA